MGCAVRSMQSMPHYVLGRGKKESARGTMERAYGLVARLQFSLLHRLLVGIK